MSLRLGLGLQPLGSDGASGAPPNLPPSDVDWAGDRTVAEDAALGTQVGGALSFVDPGDTGTFTLTDDADGLFGIGPDGASVIVTGVLDYEAAASHQLTVRFTDSANQHHEEQFTVTVTDVSEEPAEDPPPDDGDVVVDDPGNFDNPPVVTTIDAGIAFHGKKKAGVQGKFIYDIGPAQAGHIYTMRYDPDWSLLANGGVTAMVAFGLKDGNAFRLSGLKGDGSSGLDAKEVHGSGSSGWAQGTGHTAVDGGDAQHGTQAGPNWLQFEVSADGTEYTLRTSADGESWDDEFTDVTPTPHSDVDGVPSFGIAVLLEAADAGPFRVDITLWTALSLVPATFAGAVTQHITLTDGNLGVAPAASVPCAAFLPVFKSSGKHYFECEADDIGVNGEVMGVAPEGTVNGHVAVTFPVNSFNVAIGSGTVTICGHSPSGTAVGTSSVGDILCFAIDLDNWLGWVRRNNGNWNNNASADPAAGTLGISLDMWRTTRVSPFCSFLSTSFGFGAKRLWNFGASAFAQAVPSGFTAGWIGDSEEAAGHGSSTRLVSSLNGLFKQQLGELLALGWSSGIDVARIPWSDFRSSGKFYVEFNIRDATGNGDCWGVMTDDATATNVLTNGTNCSVVYFTGAIWSNNANTSKTLGARADGDIIGVAVDLDNEKVWFRVAPSGNWNGEAIGSQNPATNTGGVSLSNYTAKTLAPCIGKASFTVGDYSLNAGQAPFIGTPPSGFTSGWPSAGASLPTMKYRGTISVAAGGTLSGNVDIGPAAADCLVVVAVTHLRNSGATGRTVTAVSIGGSNGTIHAAINANAGGGGGVAIASRVVTTGGSCAVAVTLDDASGTATAMDVFTITGLNSTTPHDTHAVSGNNPALELDTALGGVLLLAASTATQGIGMSGNEQVRDNFGISTLSSSVSWMLDTPAQSNKSTTVSSIGADEAGAAVSWR